MIGRSKPSARTCNVAPMPFRMLAYLSVIVMLFFSLSAKAQGLTKGNENVPPWVKAGVTNASLPVIRSPFIWTFDVTSDKTIHITGEITKHSAKKFDGKAAIFLVTFLSADGKELEIASEKLHYSSWLKGYYSYLAGMSNPVPFYIEIAVPKGAVKATIRLARMDNKVDDTKLKRFSCRVTKSVNGKSAMAFVYFLFGVALVALGLLRRKGHDEISLVNESLLVTNSKFLKAWKFCAVALVVIMGCVFFRETYMAIVLNSNLMPLSCVLGGLLALFLLTYLICSIAPTRTWISFLIVIVMCFVAHIIVIRLTHILYTQSMTDDFAMVEAVIKDAGVKIAHTRTCYWANYELLCSFLGKVFCPDVQVAQYLNALCCIAAIYPVYKLSCRIGGRRIAIFTSLLMALSPITQVYGTLLTGEFIAAAAYAWAIYFTIELLEAQGAMRKCVMALWTGVFLGIGNLAKPFAIVFLMTLVTLVIIDIIRLKWRNITQWLAALFLLLGAYTFLSLNGQYAILEMAKPQTIALYDQKDAFVGLFLQGFNVETQGRYNLSWKNKVNSMSKEEKVATLKQMIRRDWQKYPALLLGKLDHAYSDPYFGWSWYEKSIRPGAVPVWVKKIICSWNLIALLFVAIGFSGLVMACRQTERKNLVGIVVTIGLAGATLILLLSEAQPRYKMALYPLYFLLIPYAGEWLKLNNPFYIKVASMVRRLVERYQSSRR